MHSVPLMAIILILGEAFLQLADLIPIVKGLNIGLIDDTRGEGP